MQKFRETLWQLWNRLPFAHKRMTIFWFILLIGLILMAVTVTHNFPDDRTVIILTSSLFVINSLLFFIAPNDPSKIKVVMLTFLTIILLACLTFYALTNGTVSI